MFFSDLCNCFEYISISKHLGFVVFLCFFKSKVEDAFYKGELRLNGEKLWKKSRTVRYDSQIFLSVALSVLSATLVSPQSPYSGCQCLPVCVSVTLSAIP